MLRTFVYNKLVLKKILCFTIFNMHSYTYSVLKIFRVFNFRIVLANHETFSTLKISCFMLHQIILYPLFLYPLAPTFPATQPALNFIHVVVAT